MSKYSLIIPIYKNESNVLPLLNELKKIDEHFEHQCEFVFVIDGSPDNSESLILNHRDEYIKVSQIISLSKNYGSFTAIRAGMAESKGEFLAVMAADLQEPPYLIIELFKSLTEGYADVCFGERKSRNDPLGKKILSNIFWGFYRRFVIPEIPSGGVDIFSCTRIVANSILQIEERNSSLIAQLFWVGYKRAYIPYDRKEREIGESGWSFKKRVRYMLDSIFSYTDIPIVLLLSIGSIGLILSLLYVMILSVSYFLGVIQQPGFATQSMLITIFGSSILLSQGILGCYIWRVLENSKKRPLYFISKKTDSKDD